MEHKRKIKKITRLLLTLLLVTAAVVAIRHYLIGSYRISTPAMENTLKEGDLILVKKWTRQPERNRVVLFVSPLLKDTLSPPLFLSRCIGLPGDTIHVGNDGYRINGQFFPLSPNAMCQYQVESRAGSFFFSALNKLDIPMRDVRLSPKEISISLTLFEEYSIREELSEEVNSVFVRQETEEYSLVIPRRNRPYRINGNGLTAGTEAITRESDLPVAIRNNKLFIDGRETDFFFFEQDYYWVLSDNTKEGIDSRHLGFIPADHILGTAWYCWFSRQTDHLFNAVN